MRVLPIDVSAFTGGVVCVGVRPKLFRETADSEPRQRTDTQQVPQWSCEILFRGAEDQKSDLEEVTITSTSRPEVDGPVEFDSLVGVSWSMGDRSGIAFRADNIRNAGASSGGQRQQAKEQARSSEAS